MMVVIRFLSMFTSFNDAIMSNRMSEIVVIDRTNRTCLYGLTKHDNESRSNIECNRWTGRRCWVSNQDIRTHRQASDGVEYIGVSRFVCIRICQL